VQRGKGDDLFVRVFHLAVTSALLLGIVTACSGTSGSVTSAPIARSGSPTAPAVTAFDLPSVDADGFPARVYAKAGPGGGGSIPGCPSAQGLKPFKGTAPARAAVVWATVLSRTFR
jgi:hypothetical protein